MKTSQILSSIAFAGAAAAAPTAAGLFKWFGINESGAEFGQGNIPGTYNKDYTFPSNSALDVSIIQERDHLGPSSRLSRH